MKIVSIIGARPQFIKAAPVSRELRKKHKEVLVHTGQHYDYGMSEIFFDELGIPEPDYNLGVGSGEHGAQTGQMLIELEMILLKEEPDAVLVYGDTNSTLAGALAAVKLHIPVAHVEAGLRSFDRKMPEEINRILTDCVSKLLFCPTQTAIDNLKNEGVSKGVHLTGDVMFDSVIHNIKIAESKSSILKQLQLKKKGYFLVTIHRPSNTDDENNLKGIFEALTESKEKMIIPLHPRTRKNLRAYGLYDTLKQTDNIYMIDPVSYLDMLVLEKNACKILTDSGGIQKEAYFFQVPCITMRDTSEWIETISDEWNILVSADKEKIMEAIKNFTCQNKQTNVFGDGKASKKIVEILS